MHYLVHHRHINNFFIYFFFYFFIELQNLHKSVTHRNDKCASEFVSSTCLIRVQLARRPVKVAPDCIISFQNNSKVGTHRESVLMRKWCLI